ncbi:MAG TPA: hypothetical protein EYG57_01320, partial [Planctomycetes bacterium]|nr:hypothetical protein [Planctomycetota bacterium]
MRRHLFGLIVCCEIIAAAAILLSVAGVVHGVDVWKRIGTSLAVVWMAIAWLVAVTSRTHGPILQLHRWLFETSWEVTLRYVAFLRFQILLLLALVLFPWLARTSLDRLLGNLFLVSLLDV